MKFQKERVSNSHFDLQSAQQSLPGMFVMMSLIFLSSLILMTNLKCSEGEEQTILIHQTRPLFYTSTIMSLNTRNKTQQKSRDKNGKHKLVSSPKCSILCDREILRFL